MKKIMIRGLIVIFAVGMLITLLFNVLLQTYFEKKTFQDTTAENFWQIENIIKNNDIKLSRLKAELAETCIVRARAVAYIAEKHPEIIDDIEECKMVASLLQVDEIHFFNQEGSIYAGTNPEYYNYSFSMGGQIGYFEPMLDDYGMELCQDITPNTAENKLMQYAAVWSADRKVIVQVGLEPERVSEEIEGNSTSDIFSMMSTDTTSTFYAADKESSEIVGSTKEEHVGLTLENIGFEVTQVGNEISYGYLKMESGVCYYGIIGSGDLLLIKVYPIEEMYGSILQNTMIMFGCFLLLFAMLVIGCFVFTDRRIIKSILSINAEMKKIEQGKWNTVLHETSLPEFEQLSGSINSMVETLVDFPKKVSRALELSEMPMAICEYMPEKNRLTVTSRAKDILCLTDRDMENIMKEPETFEDRVQEICCEATRYEENIYCLKDEAVHFVKVEKFNYKKSRMTILFDMTKEVEEKRRISKERDTDPLTGLHNRRAFFEQMEKVFADTEQMKSGVLIMIDLDELKHVNDVYGHQSGDAYLLAFAQILSIYTGERSIGVRMGGDEFILFAYGMEDIREAEKLLQDLTSHRDRKMVEIRNGNHVTLKYSVGCAYYPSEKTEYNELVKLADMRMYEDKVKRKSKKKEC